MIHIEMELREARLFKVILSLLQADASFGVNCDVPNLHFEDTCVTDDDCGMFPNTVCSNQPLNSGLDPGTRAVPFEDWEDREKLLKSCFCKEGHIRIPLSTGCYDPVRRVVTLKDPCFADYHCNDLVRWRQSRQRMGDIFCQYCRNQI